MKPNLLHATCVCLKGKGILICGKPGSGKSSLALQLMDRGAVLVSDDQTHLTQMDHTLIASPPASLRGLLEVRGVGICTFAYQDQAPVDLWVDICEEKSLERLPIQSSILYHSIEIPYLKLKENEILAPLKVKIKMGLNDTQH